MTSPDPEFPISYDRLRKSAPPQRVSQDFDLTGWPEAFSLRWERNYDRTRISILAYSSYLLIVWVCWTIGYYVGADWMTPGFVSGLAVCFFASGPIRSWLRKALGSRLVQWELLVSRSSLRLSRSENGAPAGSVTISRSEPLRVSYPIQSRFSPLFQNMTLFGRETMQVPLMRAKAEGIAQSHADTDDVVFAWLPESVFRNEANRMAIREYEGSNDYWHPANIKASRHELIARGGTRRVWFELGAIALVIVTVTVLWGAVGAALLVWGIMAYMWGAFFVVDRVRAHRRRMRESAPSSGPLSRRSDWVAVGDADSTRSGPSGPAGS